jgi:ribosomal protein S18 acetylase RimI-like enzyme
MPDVQLRDQLGGSGSTCRKILAALPTWFGVEESVEDYITSAEESPTVIASIAGDDVGVLTIRLHSQYAAEIYVMAVLPGHHRQGIGRRMLQHAENALARDGVEFLQVKTLSAAHPDDGYKRTRAFYFAYGFRPLEEFPDLWSPQNPALQMIKTVAAHSA